MNPLENRTLTCPYCGEPNDLLIDCSATSQRYVEDCQVCCQPMVVDVIVDPDDTLSVTAGRENE